MASFREPLLIPCIAFAAGILATRYATWDSTELIAAFLAFAFAAYVSRQSAPRLFPVTTAGCVLVLGAAIAEYRRPPPPPTFDADPGEVILVSGCVVEPLSIRDERGRFTLEIEPGARANVTFRVPPEAPPPSIPYGSRVEFPARVRPPRNFGNPGAFDYAGYLARRNTYWLAAVPSKSEIQKLPGTCATPTSAALMRLRETALKRLEWLYRDDLQTSGFMRALLLGEDDRLERSTSDDYRRTGTYHAIVISGLHISLVAGSVLWLLRRACLPLLLRLLVAGVVAWTYTLVAGADPPVLRAALGFSLALIASAFYRKVRVLNILAAVALGFLILDPGQLFEPSFQLSFLAVAAIGGVAAPILDRTSVVLQEAAGKLEYVRPSPSIARSVASLRVELRLLAQTVALVCRVSPAVATGAVRWGALVLAGISEMVVLSACLQFALTLPAIFYFHRLPLTGILANLLAVPLLNIAVALGMTGLLAGSQSISWFTARIVKAAGGIISWFASVEPDWRAPDPEIWLALLFAASVILVAFMLRRYPRLALASGLVSVGRASALFVRDSSRVGTGWLEVSTIDVGQGDSILTVFPTGETMLIDGGGIPSFRGNPTQRLDIGEQVVSPYLWHRGLGRIDLMVMTHAHDDHSQGLQSLVRNFHPSELWTGALPETASTQLLAEARRLGTRVIQPKAGYTRKVGKVEVFILAPSPDYVPGTSAKNNDSLVLEIRYGRRRFVMTGDAERAIESELVASGALHPIDVLKVGHHGSKTSTTPELLALLRPVFAVVSVGEGNLYGHPHPDVLGRLAEGHVRTFRTDRMGLTSFKTDGYRIRVETNSINWADSAMVQ